MFHVPNKFRFRDKSHSYCSEDSDGNNGAFYIDFKSYTFVVVASDGEGWEHVSVSLTNRCPNWIEMCFIKNLFWDKSDTVIQFHPSEEDYVDLHPHCLHMWKPTDQEIPKPPREFVG